MWYKPRKVRRSTKFQPHIRRETYRRREYAASVMSTAVVQFVLAIALLVAAFRSYQAVSIQAPESTLALQLVMPVAFTVGGAWCIRLAVKNFRSAREIWSVARKSAPPEQ